MSNFTYVCDGNSCCLIPNYNNNNSQQQTEKKCFNYKICFNEISNDEEYEFCKDCMTLPFENKKIILLNENQECPICSKYMKLIKRNNCDHFMCNNCFKKIFFDKPLSRPVFPYLVKDENKYMTDNEDDENIIKYKNQLEYWDKFQNINHNINKKCKQCLQT